LNHHPAVDLNPVPEIAFARRKKTILIMLYPRAWRDSMRIAKALRSYPEYTPPHRGDYASLSRAQGEENFAYFLEQKPRRLDSLTRLLAYFDVSATLDHAGLRRVSAWVHRYSGHLIGKDVISSSDTYHSFTPPWTHANAGLNAVWDLGVYTGEYVTSVNPAHKWGLDLGDRHRVSREVSGYLRPCIFIAWRPVRRFPVFDFSFATAKAKRRVMTIGSVLVGDPNAPADGFQAALTFWAGSNPRQAASVR
jgi:hypothetical protein